MKNYVKPGNEEEFTAPVGGVTSGQLLIVGDLAVVSSVTVAEGELFNAATVGTFSFPKDSATVFDEGVLVYFDDANPGQVIDVDGGGSNKLIGAAATTGGAQAGSDTVQVRLNGSAA